MVLLVIISINVENEIVGGLLIKRLKEIYLAENPNATAEMAEEAMNHNEYSDAMREAVYEYNNYFLVIQLALMVIIITIFVWIILRRVHRELKSFEIALDSISSVDVADWEIVTIKRGETK